MAKYKIKRITTYNDGKVVTSYLLKNALFTEFTDFSRAKIFNSKKQALDIIKGLKGRKCDVWEVVAAE